MELSHLGADNCSAKYPRSAIAASCLGIMNAVPAAAYTCDVSGLITYFNPLAVAVWGRAPKLCDATDRYCGSHRLYSSEGVPIRHDECWMAMTLLHGIPYRGRPIVIARRDGSTTVGEAYAHPLRNEHGQVVGAVNLVADITALRKAGASNSSSRSPSVAHSAITAIVDTALSVFGAMTWKDVAFFERE
jgi:PAS domain-containing protein